VGDFNGKNKLWGSPFNDARGNCVESFLELNDMVCLNKGDPTHLNYNGTLSHLDLVICSKNLAMNGECNIMDETWGSDHYPIEISFDDCTPTINISIEHKYNLDKANWKLYKSLLQYSSFFDSKIEDISANYDNFLTVILEARDVSIPKKKRYF